MKFDMEAGTATLGAGCLVKEVMDEAQKHKAHVGGLHPSSPSVKINTNKSQPSEPATQSGPSAPV